MERSWDRRKESSSAASSGVEQVLVASDRNACHSLSSTRVQSSVVESVQGGLRAGMGEWSGGRFRSLYNTIIHADLPTLLPLFNGFLRHAREPAARRKREVSQRLVDPNQIQPQLVKFPVSMPHVPSRKRLRPCAKMCTTSSNTGASKQRLREHGDRALERQHSHAKVLLNLSPQDTSILTVRRQGAVNFVGNVVRGSAHAVCDVLCTSGRKTLNNTSFSDRRKETRAMGHLHAAPSCAFRWTICSG